MNEILMILNPAAGGGRCADDARELARSHGWKLQETAESGDARRLAAKLGSSAPGTIVAAGGDGTINEVINGLMEHREDARPRLGILPCGTANDFVKLQRPGLRWKEAVAAILKGQGRKFDLAEVSGGRRHHFANAATGGISAEIHERLDDGAKSWWGSFSYFRIAAKIIPRAAVYEARVKAGNRSFEGRAMALMIANGRHAGGVKLLPNADPTDHHLDVAVVKAETLAELSALLAQFAVGKHEESAHFWLAKAREIEVECDPAMTFIGDGEALGETPLRFRVIPGAIEICTPPGPPA